MNAEDRARSEEIFLAAADLPDAEQRRFLDSSCGQDTALREEVESLLRADGQDDRIVRAIEEEAQSLLGLEGLIGARIGAYRITGEIGRGGMGTVYLAVRDDDQYQKQVAIKLVRPGMDTQDVLERFRHERQILANLDHPNIARLLDAGTVPGGGPFFVMELVDGEPLDVYCRNRKPGIRDRCRLFLEICEAVAYAHRNLVVHRDLKPANILVAPSGSPKLLDFGVAKLLSPDTAAAQTVAQTRLLTPEYASPEHVRGEPITTAADVYSLGAILYELLSGERAHRLSSHSLHEVERVVCQTDPVKPSEAAPQSRRELRGDLDAIVAMALRKEPGRRYSSVEQFAADVRAWLEGWPVKARQGDFVYRAHKFLVRNRIPIAAGTLAAAAMVAGTTVATLQAVRAGREQARAEREQGLARQSQKNAEAQAVEARSQRAYAEVQQAAAERERALADRRFDQVRQLSGKFLLQFHDAIANLPGSTAARKMVVETGLQYYDTLVKEAAGNQALLEEIARGYDRLGDAQGNPYYANMGDIPAAAASYRKALAIRARVSDESPEFIKDRILGQIRIAQILIQQGDFRNAERYLVDALDFGQRGSAAQTWEVRDAVFRNYSTLGDLQNRKGDFTQSVETYRKLLTIAEQMAEKPKDLRSARSGVSVAQTKLGEGYWRLGNNADALNHLRLALVIDTEIAQSNPDNMPATRKLYITNMLLGQVLRSPTGRALGRPGEEKEYLEQAANLADRMAAADPKNNMTATDILVARMGYGDWLRAGKDTAGAVAQYRQAVDASRRISGAGPLTAANADALYQAYQRLAGGLTDAGQFEEALRQLEQAGEYLATEEKQTPGVAWNEIRKSEFLLTRGVVYQDQQRWREAIADFSAAIATYERMRKTDSTNQNLVADQPELYARIADCYAGTGQTGEAAGAIQSALDRFGELEKLRPLVPEEESRRKENLTKLAALKP